MRWKENKKKGFRIIFYFIDASLGIFLYFSKEVLATQKKLTNLRISVLTELFGANQNSANRRRPLATIN